MLQQYYNTVFSFGGLLLAIWGLSGVGCRPVEHLIAPAALITPTAVSATRPLQPPATQSPAATLLTPPSPTPRPTATRTPLPTHTPTPTETPTATPIPLCSARVPSDDDLLTVVTLHYGLSREYKPADLVPLSDYFDHTITFGYPTQVRALIVEPLVAMVGDMQAAGLHPQIISGYRSFYSQQIAFDKWVEKHPDRVAGLSAPPGFSEHQLGTTIDFGSPELAEIVGDEEIEFHTYFYKTSEGAWLLENAHRYGFTLSYPRSAQEVTGFFYEPWHYRYVGVEMATMLKEKGLSLTEFQLAQNPEPCIP